MIVHTDSMELTPVESSQLRHSSKQEAQAIYDCEDVTNTVGNNIRILKKDCAYVKNSYDNYIIMDIKIVQGELTW